MTSRSLALLLALAAALGGCGTYNPEDLVFRAAAPRPEDVALAPPGVDPTASEAAAGQVSQGLTVCDGVRAERNLRCYAQSVAGFLNGLTFGVLTLVDEVVQAPPSQRERGRRVWGPHFDAGDDASYRFEMARADDGGFDWCLHVAPGRAGPLAARGLTCADAEGGDFVRVVWGHLQPGDVEGEAARRGAGEVVLDVDALARVRREDAGGLFTIVYDNRAGETGIDISLDGVRAPGFPADSEYRYRGSLEGGGTFLFTAEGEVFDGAEFEEELPETLTVTAQWRPDRAGRADAVITGGNLSSFELSATQCWDEELCQVYYGDDDRRRDEGDEADCVFSERLDVD